MKKFRLRMLLLECEVIMRISAGTSLQAKAASSRHAAGLAPVSSSPSQRPQNPLASLIAVPCWLLPPHRWPGAARCRSLVLALSQVYIPLVPLGTRRSVRRATPRRPRFSTSPSSTSMPARPQAQTQHAYNPTYKLIESGLVVVVRRRCRRLARRGAEIGKKW